MTVEEIFEQFNNVYTDNQSELSEEELFVLLNKVLTKIINDRDWYFNVKTFTGQMIAGQDYVEMPSDFKKFHFNFSQRQTPQAVVYVGTGNYPDVFRIIQKSNARMHKDINGFCYVDTETNRLVFTRTPDQNDEVSFEYVPRFQKLDSIDQEPPIPEDYHHSIVHAMAEEYPMIDQMERQFSFARENEQKLEEILEDMRLEDANIKLNM